MKNFVWLVLLVCVVAFSGCGFHLYGLLGREERSATGIYFPLEGKWKPILRSFGYWAEDRSGYHLGEDIQREPETPVYPMAPGIVKLAAYLPGAGLGYAVIIEYKLPNGAYCCSVSYHMRQPMAGEGLVEGSAVFPDKPIGYVSGVPVDHQNTTPHLHSGIRLGKFRADYPDPRTQVWFYPGYTTIYLTPEAKTKRGPVKNRDYPTHKEILGEWRAPSDFIKTHQ